MWLAKDQESAFAPTKPSYVFRGLVAAEIAPDWNPWDNLRNVHALGCAWDGPPCWESVAWMLAHFGNQSVSQPMESSAAYAIQVQGLQPYGSKSDDQTPSKTNHEVAPIAISVLTDYRDASGLTHYRWGAPFFGCMEVCMPNCFMSMLCPCVSAAQIATRLGIWGYEMALFIFGGLVFGILVCLGLALSNFSSGYNNDFEDGKSGKHGPIDPDASDSGRGHPFGPSPDDNGRPYHRVFAILALVFALCLVVLIAQLRASIRRQYSIPGCQPLDCLLVAGCMGCSLAQMATHVQSYTPGACDFDSKDVLPSYNESTPRE